MVGQRSFPSKWKAPRCWGSKCARAKRGPTSKQAADLQVAKKTHFREAQLAAEGHLNMHDVGFRRGGPSPPGDDGDHGGPPDDRDDGHHADACGQPGDQRPLRGKTYTCSIRKGLVCRMDSNCYWRSEVLLLSPNAHLDWQGDAWMTCRECWGELSGKELPTCKE